MTKRERREKIQEMIASPVLQIARKYNKADKNLKRIERKINSAKNWKTSCLTILSIVSLKS